jgi:hypothetical protein
VTSRALEASEFDAAHSAFRRVFASGDPYGAPFADSMVSRLLMFPTHWVDLRPRIWPRVDWLPSHLSHIVGADDAERMLEEAGWFHGEARI